MHEYQFRILEFLKERGKSSFEDIVEATEISSDAARWAVETLAEQKAIGVSKGKTLQFFVTEEGKGYLEEMPEEAFVKQLAKEGPAKVGEVKNSIGMMWAKRNGWIAIEGGFAKLTEEGMRQTKSGKYLLREVLRKLSSQEAGGELAEKHRKEIEVLQKRGLVKVIEKYAIEELSITSEGKRMLEEGLKEEGENQLTKEMLLSGSWKSVKFKSYNINAPAEEVYAARLHPMREFNNYLRNIWVSMGFTEVSGPIIESAFWDFDALFSPQDHPTREMQDTFFLSNPKEISIEDLSLLKRVKKMHTSSWGDVWREEVAKQALLRTHSTSVSAHYIYKFSKLVGEEYPVKLFSLGKVFRNESIDYKHLAELTQYDGIIIGDKLSFSNLIDTLRRFYELLGFDTNPRNKKFKFKPSYFPFVEPGLEALYYDESKQDWIELVGGGIIRKEITKALGTNKTVLAWGGGVERLLFHFMDLDSLTTLYKNEIQWLRKRPRVDI
ncbi:MAG: phenylalanine--tRNA ligase subunit alpha [Candidatus Micrarchaeia archaeon]